MAAPRGVAKNDRELQAQVYLQIGAPYCFWSCRQGTLYFNQQTTQRQTLKVFGAAFLQKGGSSSAEGKNTEPKAKTRLAGGVDAEVLAAVEGVAVAVEGVGREGEGWGLVGIFANLYAGSKAVVGVAVVLVGDKVTERVVDAANAVTIRIKPLLVGLNDVGM